MFLSNFFLKKTLNYKSSPYMSRYKLSIEKVAGNRCYNSKHRNTRALDMQCMCVAKTEAFQIEISYIKYCTDWTTAVPERTIQRAQFMSLPIYDFGVQVHWRDTVSIRGVNASVHLLE